jgi:tripartite-type tricarboxylate transporter receptor subunit TctC
MNPISRRLLLTLVSALALGPFTAAGAADAFPSKPLKVYVGYSAGGAVDAIARSVGQQMATTLGQPVVVENKPGAATNIAVKSVITSAPDGYTLLMAANALAVNPSLFQPAPYDLQRELTPIASVGRVPVVFAVRAESALKGLPDLVSAAKAQPGGVTVATPGNGATPHLAMELFQHTAKLSLKHVPYKGGAQAITDVLGGHVDVVAVNALEVLRAGLSEQAAALVVPFTPGGSSDVLGRAIGLELGRAGQPVVIDNVPGAGGSLGADKVAKSPADGYTLLMGHIGTLAVNPSLYPKLGYDPVRSFAPVAWVARVPNVLVVHESVPARPEGTGRAVEGAARQLAYGSGGNGSAAHITMEYLKLQTGTSLLHIPTAARRRR